MNLLHINWMQRCALFLRFPWGRPQQLAIFDWIPVLVQTWNCRYGRRFLWEMYVRVNGREDIFQMIDLTCRDRHIGHKVTINLQMSLLNSPIHEQQNIWNFSIKRRNRQTLLSNLQQLCIFQLNLFSLIQMMGKTKYLCCRRELVVYGHSDFSINQLIIYYFTNNASKQHCSKEANMVIMV